MSDHIVLNHQLISTRAPAKINITMLHEQCLEKLSKDDKSVKRFSWRPASQVGISGTTAKSRQRKFVPSSHPGPFALVASSHKCQIKVGTLACFDCL